MLRTVTSPGVDPFRRSFRLHRVAEQEAFYAFERQDRVDFANVVLSAVGMAAHDLVEEGSIPRLVPVVTCDCAARTTPDNCSGISLKAVKETE